MAQLPLKTQSEYDAKTEVYVRLTNNSLVSRSVDMQGNLGTENNAVSINGLGKLDLGYFDLKYTGGPNFYYAETTKPSFISIQDGKLIAGGTDTYYWGSIFKGWLEGETEMCNESIKNCFFQSAGIVNTYVYPNSGVVKDITSGAQKVCALFADKTYQCWATFTKVLPPPPAGAY